MVFGPYFLFLSAFFVVSCGGNIHKSEKLTREKRTLYGPFGVLQKMLVEKLTVIQIVLKMFFGQDFLVLSALFVIVCSENFTKLGKLDREKRTTLLLYGPFGILQLILGFGTPIADLLTPSTTLGYFMRGIYSMPKNATDYSHPNITELTRSLPITRWDIYQWMEKDSELRGHGGRPCVLRAICQAAETPIDKYHGFFEEVFHTIFTPMSTNEKIREHSDNDYFAAHDMGKKNPGKCKQLYPECQFTFLDLFTQLLTNFDND